MQPSSNEPSNLESKFRCYWQSLLFRVVTFHFGFAIFSFEVQSCSEFEQLDAIKDAWSAFL